MILRIAVVYEADADFRTATELADRVFLETFDWLADVPLDGVREWVAGAKDGRRFTWTQFKHLANELRIPARGHFDNEPGQLDAKAARRTLDCLLALKLDLDAILFVRDHDNKPERKKGLEQARADAHGKLPIVIGLAIPKRECWVLSGFDPLDEGEHSRLDAERKHLGFDPRANSHQLTATEEHHAKRSAKRVLRALTQGDHDRERRCWTEARLETLRERGEENGLAAYLHEVRERLTKLLGHVR